MTASQTAYVGVGLKLDCPAGRYVSFITGMGSPSLTYQVVWIPGQPSLPLPWPPLPGSAVYGERCPCDECCGRLVGDTVAAIEAEARGVQATMKVNEDTYNLRYLESAREAIIRQAQFGGYGIIHGKDARANEVAFTETYVTPERRVSVQYDDELEEVEQVTAWLPVSTQPQPTYPNTLAGALAALRASD